MTEYSPAKTGEYPRTLSLDIIFSSKFTVFLELPSRKTVRFSEQIMSADKYPAYFRAKWGLLFMYIIQMTFPSSGPHHVSRAVLGSLRPIYTVRLYRTRHVYDRPATCLRSICTRTTFSRTKLNMQKFAPGFTERKF